MSTLPGALDNPNQQARVTGMTRTMGRIDWEDIIQAPKGDFNDMTGLLEARQCDALPLQAGPAYELAQFDCEDPCFNAAGTCDPAELDVGIVGASGGDPAVVHTVSATVDRADSEYDGAPPNREARGRLMHVAVGTFVNPVDASFVSIRAAVCPTLRIDLARVAGGAFADIYPVDYNVDPNTCAPQSPFEGLPQCAPSAFGQHQEVTLSLARDQFYAEQCAPSASRVGSGDGFELRRGTDANACGQQDNYVSHYELYEISLDELDASIAAAGIVISPPLADRTVDEIRFAIAGLDLKLVTSIDAIVPFYCPSGLNLDIRSVFPGTLQSLSFTTAPPPPSPLEDSGFPVRPREDP